MRSDHIYVEALGPKRIANVLEKFAENDGESAIICQYVIRLRAEVAEDREQSPVEKSSSRVAESLNESRETHIIRLTRVSCR